MCPPPLKRANVRRGDNMVKIKRASYHVGLVGVCILTSLTSALGGDGDPRAPLDRRLQSVAGDSARNCGTVTLEESAKKANQCVRRAFSAKKAFYVRYDLASSDSVSGAGLAGNGIDVYLVEFDTVRFTPGMTRGSEQLLDEGHSLVTPCPKPIRFRTPFALGRGLTCLPPNRKNPGILSPR